MLRKIGQNYQIAIPKEIVKSIGLSINEYIDIKLSDNKIILEPQIVIPKDQQYFYTEEWQKEEREASDDIKKGRITKTKNVDELLTNLDK